MGFPRKSTKTYDAASLYEYAVGALGRQMRTVAELKRLLRRRVAKQEDGDVLVEAVVQKLKDQKYLNDTNYATAYSGFRRENEKFGKRRVITDLKAKGVHQDVIEKTVSAAYEGVDEEKLARDFLKRKRLRKPSNEKEAARVFRTLMRGGFNTNVIFRILKQWDVDDELLTVMESEAGPDGEDKDTE
jgi:regulatory protein